MKRVAVIPAHDEEGTVGEVALKAGRHVDLVIVVDDGSSDRTATIAREAGAEVVELQPNRGKGGALEVGIARALEVGAEQVVTLDADGEHDPDAIPLFLQALEEADVALGWREVYRSGARQALNRFALFFFQLLDPAIRDSICGFRAFRATALPAVRNDAGGFSYEHEVILRAVAGHLKLASVPVQTVPRTRTHVRTRDLVGANNHFDRWVLGHLRDLPLPAWRKALLAAGCVAGLATGAPVEWALSRRSA